MLLTCCIIWDSYNPLKLPTFLFMLQLIIKLRLNILHFQVRALGNGLHGAGDDSLGFISATAAKRIRFRNSQRALVLLIAYSSLHNGAREHRKLGLGPIDSNLRGNLAGFAILEQISKRIATGLPVLDIIHSIRV